MISHGMFQAEVTKDRFIDKITITSKIFNKAKNNLLSVAYVTAVAEA
jgi:hypothetical protein